jgi:hypothetical protein
VSLLSGYQLISGLLLNLTNSLADKSEILGDGIKRLTRKSPRQDEPGARWLLKPGGIQPRRVLSIGL